MKKLLLAFLFLSHLTDYSQSRRRCGFLEAQELLFQQDPGARQRTEELLKETGQINTDHKNNSVPLYTIPVVFHILHQGGSENISDAQILDALAILNRDFNKENADTVNIVAPFQNIASDCNIEFRLATLDEFGNCTTGITRHYDSNTDWPMSSAAYKYTWNRTRYLNIYVVKTLAPGVAAYTYLPGVASAVMDAVVAIHNYVGSIGTGWAGGSRTLTHEVGHWLNLQHTWGSTNQAGVACGDDGVGDTPLTKGFSFCNLSNPVQCTPGIAENIQNYMEYAFCSNMFTLGQRNRMHNALNSSSAGRINLWSPANLQFTGVFNPPFGCPPKADFASGRQVACVGDTVSFTDYSYNGTVLNWNWSSPAAANTSTLQNGKLIFNTPGSASVKLKVSNSGGSDSIVKTSLMILPAIQSSTTQLSQGFESGIFPDNDWQRTLPEYGSAFQTTTLSFRSGSVSLWVNNFYDNPNEKVSFFSPAFVFQQFSPSQLNFYYAYAQKSGASNDLLRVSASTNCGNSWTEVFSLQGANLSTVGSAINSPFFASSVQYSLVSVNLSAFANQITYLRFEFFPDPLGPGNNIFIDNINISGVTGISENSSFENITPYPNPFSQQLNIMGLETGKKYSVHLRNILGEELFSDSDFQKGNTIRFIPQLKSGVYLLQINTDSGSRIFKIISQI